MYPTRFVLQIAGVDYVLFHAEELSQTDANERLNIDATNITFSSRIVVNEHCNYYVSGARWLIFSSIFKCTHGYNLCSTHIFRFTCVFIQVHPEHGRMDMFRAECESRCEIIFWFRIVRRKVSRQTICSKFGKGLFTGGERKLWPYNLVRAFFREKRL